jgi:hypothetical protein
MGRKWYKCGIDECNSRFMRTDALKNHQWRKHPDSTALARNAQEYQSSGETHVIEGYASG